MNKNELIAIRNSVPGDRNFILATFLRGLYYGDSWFSEMEKKTFMEYYNKIVNIILDSPNTSVNVACLRDDPNTVLGYAILLRDEGIQFVFVKRQWRGIGIAKDLVPPSMKIVTHLTKVGLSIARKKNLVFNPFLM